jgi:hypothetical protein
MQAASDREELHAARLGPANSSAFTDFRPPSSGAAIIGLESQAGLEAAAGVLSTTPIFE